MNKLMRLLMMFGPMLYRFYQKYQRNKSNQAPTQNIDSQLDSGHQANTQQNTGSH